MSSGRLWIFQTRWHARFVFRMAVGGTRDDVSGTLELPRGVGALTHAFPPSKANYLSASSHSHPEPSSCARACID
jgi:hypothetical protein